MKKPLQTWPQALLKVTKQARTRRERRRRAARPLQDVKTGSLYLILPPRERERERCKEDGGAGQGESFIVLDLWTALCLASAHREQQQAGRESNASKLSCEYFHKRPIRVGPCSSFSCLSLARSLASLSLSLCPSVCTWLGYCLAVRPCTPYWLLINHAPFLFQSESMAETATSVPPSSVAPFLFLFFERMFYQCKTHNISGTKKKGAWQLAAPFKTRDVRVFSMGWFCPRLSSSTLYGWLYMESC